MDWGGEASNANEKEWARRRREEMRRDREKRTMRTTALDIAIRTGKERMERRTEKRKGQPSRVHDGGGRMGKGWGKRREHARNGDGDKRGRRKKEKKKERKKKGE